MTIGVRANTQAAVCLVCLCVFPDLLDSEQLIHYSKQALSLSLSANPPPPLHQSVLVVVRTLENSREKWLRLNVLIISKGRTGSVVHAYETLPASELCLCSPSLSSGVFPLSHFGPSVHFTVNWIS